MCLLCESGISSDDWMTNISLLKFYVSSVVNGHTCAVFYYQSEKNYRLEKLLPPHSCNVWMNENCIKATERDDRWWYETESTCIWEQTDYIKLNIIYLTKKHQKKESKN